MIVFIGYLYLAKVQIIDYVFRSTTIVCVPEDRVYKSFDF